MSVLPPVRLSRASSRTNAVQRYRITTVGLLMWSLAPLVARAGTVELKNGMVLEGRPAKLMSLTRKPDPNPGPVPIYPIVMIQTGWQRYFVPERQIPANGINMDVSLTRNEEFVVPQIKQGRSEVVQSVGAIVSAQPYDPQFGRRTVTLATARGNIPVVQGITRITPRYVEVQGLTHVWDFGVGLNSVPQDTIEALLHNPLVCDPLQPQQRLARARFYISAGWYLQAFSELDSIASDFPEQQERVAAFRTELQQLFGAHVLRELQQRQKAGQYVLADESISKLPLNLLGGSVQRDVQLFITASQQERDDLDRIAASLGDLQAQLEKPEERERASVMRTQLLGELDRNGLPRMRPFLQQFNDPQLPAADKLALAYSGWMLGAEGAAADLGRAERLWEARGLVREYLRAENSLQRDTLFDELRQLESVGIGTVRQLLQQLPPPLDAETVVPGVASEVTLPTGTEGTEVRYHVVLPPEYSPQHRYPCILALRPEHKTTGQTAVWWAGTEESPGWAQRRGYIVIAPEYAPEAQREYSYGAAAHAAILTALRDARLRFAIDPDRVFLTGHDMGGDAAFDVGFSCPDQFAGVIPIGGVSDHYGTFMYQNGQYTAWYVIRGELGRDATTKSMHRLLDEVYSRGAKFDIIYAEIPGRGRDAYADELPQVFDWMEIHTRKPPPPDFELRSLRQCDNTLYWLTADPLPRNYLLPQPAGAAQGVDVMDVTGRVTPGNTITVNSPANHHILRLDDGVFDINRKVTIRINGKAKFAKFAEPDIRTMLEDFRLRGDRTRLASVIFEF